MSARGRGRSLEVKSWVPEWMVKEIEEVKKLLKLPSRSSTIRLLIFWGLYYGCIFRKYPCSEAKRERLEEQEWEVMVSARAR